MFQTLIYFCLLSLYTYIYASASDPVTQKHDQYLGRSVELFQEYLRIDTSDPENLKDAVSFLAHQLTDLGIPYYISEPAGKPILVATVLGSDPSLPSIMLNSHMDVVKADAAEWKYPPFSAHMDIDGNIYARGAQDTKDVGIQYLEAIRKLKDDNITLARTVHLTYMPDEETGGKDGMKAFVKTDKFKDLKIGFALDEGLTSGDDTLYGTYLDRRVWQMEFTITGEGGHGFKMPDNSAVENLYTFMKVVMDYRQTQKEILKTKSNSDFTGISQLTSVNLNIIKGGLAANIIPSKITVVVDMRLSTLADVADMDALVQSWMKEAGNMTEISYIRKETESRETPVDVSNPYWVTMNNTLNDMGIKIVPVVCPATSDLLVIRNQGIPAIGFTPKRRTESRLHGKDEYQNIETFLKGIDIYKELIKKLANLRL